MAEYSREQRNQLSRAIANCKSGNRQLKGFVDNRSSIIDNALINPPIQYMLSDKLLYSNFIRPAIQRKLTPATIKHIFEGDETTDKKNITGYHSKSRGDKTFAKSNGEREDLGNGFYKECVIERNPKKGKIARIKKEKSTFYPDNFTEEDIKSSIDISHGSTNPYPVACSGISFNVIKQGDTIYPYIMIKT